MAERFEGKVTLKKQIEWEQPSYGGYGYTTYRRYILETEEGKTLTWKTTSFLMIEKLNDEGIIDMTFPTDGSVLTIKASIKGETEYKGVKQIEIQRVKLIEINKMALTDLEKAEIKKNEQLESLKGKDFIWKKMPYKQYKERYSDCETIEGSFEYIRGTGCIDVIIREGRMKNSGVRGRRFFGFVLKNEKGKWSTYRAVCLENAIKQAKKEFPEHEFECIKIYDYRRMNEERRSRY